MPPDTILDAAAVAELLHCSVEQAEALMRREELRATKIGRGWITTYGEVVAFVVGRITAERHRPEPVNASFGTTSTRSRRRTLVPLPATR